MPCSGGGLALSVVGVPHAELGEEVGAAIALKPGADATVEELIAHVKAQVAASKYPATSGWWTSCPRARRPRSSGRQIAVPTEVSDPGGRQAG